MNRFLIAGGAGYIGSHVAASLANSGFFVRVMDNFSGAQADWIDSLLSRWPERAEVVEGDIRDPADCRAALDTITHVVDFASLSDVEESLRAPADYIETNVQGTTVLLEAARSAGVQRFVYGSSCAVYGETPAMSKHETNLVDPISPYACSKLAAESLCRSYHKLYDTPVIVLRYFNTYGPVEETERSAEGVLGTFLRAVMNGQTCTLHGNGEQSRDFVYVDDAVQAAIDACNAPRQAHGHVFNIGTGMRVSLNEAVAAIEKALGRTVVVHRDALRPGDISHSRADATKAAGMLQWTAAVSFDKGIARMVAAAKPPLAKAA